MLYGYGLTNRKKRVSHIITNQIGISCQSPCRYLCTFRTLSDLTYMYGPWLLQLHSSVYLININKWCLIWAESSSPAVQCRDHCVYTAAEILVLTWLGAGLVRAGPAICFTTINLYMKLINKMKVKNGHTWGKNFNFKKSLLTNLFIFSGKKREAFKYIISER